MEMELTTMKVLLVTGASRGIGAACAVLAASRGFKVCINYRREVERAQRLVAEITAAGGAAIAVQADVSLEEDVVRLFSTIDRQLGPLGALVNNAGILPSFGRVEAIEGNDLADLLRINVAGPILCAREAILRMSTRRGGQGGSIVNVGSVGSRLGAPGRFVTYAASKGAIDSFTLGLAREVGEEGIRVNAIRPGLIDTDIHASAGQPEQVDVHGASAPMKRAGRPEEVAESILWLLSDQASYVTGAIVDVTGGR
jgi:NAD(P)-dependent dehydrogenase (short-subunit alcohol dehydrogenase family)